MSQRRTKSQRISLPKISSLLIIHHPPHLSSIILTLRQERSESVSPFSGDEHEEAISTVEQDYIHGSVAECGPQEQQNG